jgi:hypothetical protein
MIRFDSLGENFRAFRGAHQRCCARRHRRPASNFVVTASNLNRFESLPAKSRCRPRAVRGGRGFKSLGGLGSVTARGLTHRFFLERQRFELFFRNQRNQTAERKPLARKSSVLKTLDLVPWPFAASDRVRSSIYFRRTLRGGRGRSKSLRPSSRDRVAPSHAFPRNAENFFSRVRRGLGKRGAEHSAKTSRNSGWGGRVPT